MSGYSIGCVSRPGGVLDSDDPLVGRLVGERRSVDEVADRVDALGGRAHRPVDLDQARGASFHAGGVESESVHVWAATGGDHQPLGLTRVVAVGVATDRLHRLDVLDECGRVDRDALALEAAVDHLGDVLVLGGQDALESLEQRHLCAESRVRGRDLRARRAGADDGERLGKVGERPGLLGADHPAAELGTGD